MKPFIIDLIAGRTLTQSEARYAATFLHQLITGRTTATHANSTASFVVRQRGKRRGMTLWLKIRPSMGAEL